MMNRLNAKDKAKLGFNELVAPATITSSDLSEAFYVSN